MSDEWQVYRVDWLIDQNVLAIGDGYRAKNSELAPTGIPFARVSNIDSGFNFISADFFPIEDLVKVGEKISRPGDVVFTSKGTVGRFAFVQEETPQFVYSPQLSYWRSLDFRRIDPRYLFCWMRSPEFIDQANRVKGQTDMADYVSLGDQRKMFLTIPPLPEQRAIAGVLGALDDKIELNRRMNRTLEDLARAIFKSWFVDFDPVSAKAEGRRPYGMSEAVAALFPAEFYETDNADFSEIPVGWTIGKIDNIGQSIRRGVNPSEVEPDTPYIGLEHMPRRSIELSHWGTAESVISNKFQFKTGEILFGKLRPYFHKVGVAATDGVCSTDVLVIMPRQREFFGILLGHLSSVTFINYVDAASEGTKMPRTSWDTMARYPIVIPDEKISACFTDLIKPMVEKIRANIWESLTLEALRDTLLPKLLSGEIRLGEAQERIHACAESIEKP